MSQFFQNKGIFGFNRNYYLLLWPIYYVYITIRTLNEGKFYDDEISDVIEMQLLLGTAILAIWLFTRWRLKESKYKFSLMLPSLLLINLSASIGAFFDNSNLFNPAYTAELENPLPFLLTGYIELFIIPILIGIGIFDYMLNLSNPFTDSLEYLYSEVEKGNYANQIVDDTLLSDSVFGPLASFTNHLLDTTYNLLTELSNSSSLIASTSEILASSSEEANASADEVASTSQSMSKGANEQAHLLADINEKMDQSTTVIERIIDQVQTNTEIILEISEETKFLALNARIESARAGAAGRGFAVVAQDVKNLADESKLAVDDISNTVNSISSTLKATFNELSASITGVSSVSEETAASAQEVAAASEEMTSTMEEVSRMAKDMSEQSTKSYELMKRFTTID